MASKSDTAHGLLRRAILDGDLEPGAALTLSTLTARFAVGWTPLREALSRLEAEGLVTSELHKGFRVAPVRAEDVRDLQHARGLVEGELIALSIRDGDAAWEARVVAAHHLLALAPPLAAGAAPADVALWEGRHEAFHAALCDGARAPTLHRFADALRDAIHRHQRVILMRAPPHPGVATALAEATALSHHTALMDAVLGRDGAGARRLLDEHIGFTLAVYEAIGRAGGA